MIDKAGRACSETLDPRFPKIVIGNDVWIGEGVFIRRGVTIGDGAIVASRAVVVKDVPPFAIVGGMPAKIIRYRFEPAVVAELLRLSWWNHGLSALDGVDFTDLPQALRMIDRNIVSGKAQPYVGCLVKIDESDGASFWSYDMASATLIPHG